MRGCYNILIEVELVISNYKESFKSSSPGFIYVHEFMLKARIKLPLKFDIAEALKVFEVASIQLMPNSWKILQGHDMTFKAMTSLSEKKSSKWLEAKLEFFDWSKAKPLKVGEVLEVYAKTMEELAEEGINIRGRQGTSSKRPLT
ncbi:hypothetical protein ACLOJK_008824 [Asimina triloba]